MPLPAAAARHTHPSLPPFSPPTLIGTSLACAGRAAPAGALPCSPPPMTARSAAWMWSGAFLVSATEGVCLAAVPPGASPCRSVSTSTLLCCCLGRMVAQSTTASCGLAIVTGYCNRVLLSLKQSNYRCADPVVSSEEDEYSCMDGEQGAACTAVTAACTAASAACQVARTTPYPHANNQRVRAHYLIPCPCHQMPPMQ